MKKRKGPASARVSTTADKKTTYNRYRRPGMLSEEFITLVTRYTVMLVFFMFFGLVNADSRGVRGFPFPWLWHGRVIAYYFQASLVFMIIMIVLTDFFARTFRRIKEPPVKTAENTNPYRTSVSVRVNDSSADVMMSRTKSSAEIPPAKMFSIIISFTTIIITVIFVAIGCSI